MIGSRSIGATIVVVLLVCGADEVLGELLVNIYANRILLGKPVGVKWDAKCETKFEFCVYKSFKMNAQIENKAINSRFYHI